MTGNHFMKIRAAAAQTGIAEGLLYDWVSKQKIAQKIGDDGVKMVSLDAVKAYRKENPAKPRNKRKAKLPGQPGMTASSNTPEVSSEHPLLKAWWDRKILPLLEAQGIRGITWQLGQSPEVELVTKVKL